MSGPRARPVVFHLDLDAFYASVEQLDRPELAGKPVIVGALPGHRGVVSTCSYEARAFGVRSAMPVSEAFRRCPEGNFVPVRMERYVELSRRVMAIFGDFTPDVRRISIDEAFLDMTGTEKLFGPPREAAARLKARVRAETGLTVSAGVAPNRYLAKIASGLGKPDGLTVVEPGGEEAFMARLPLDKLWGAGGKTRERLVEYGIDTVARLAAFPETALAAIFGKAGAAFLWRAARGIDPGIFADEPKSRSASTETTFERDVDDEATLEATLLDLASQLALRAFKEGFSSRTVVLKLRTHDFVTKSSRATREGPVTGLDELYRDGVRLLRKLWNGAPVRLIGLGLANLDEGAGAQGELFAPEGEKRARVERAVFELEAKGKGTVTRARLVGPGAPKPRGLPPDIDPKERRGP